LYYFHEIDFQIAEEEKKKEAARQQAREVYTRNRISFLIKT
jgi:hypothetical protein